MTKRKRGERKMLMPVIVTREGEKMNLREAIRILMNSPCYWMLVLCERRALIDEYQADYALAGADNCTTAVPSHS